MKILCVDDNPGDRDIIKHTLKQKFDELDFKTAASAEEAYEKAGAEDFDIILLDYRLKKITGPEVLAELNNRGVTSPVIFLTGMGNEGVAIEALKLGAYDYFTKDQLLSDRIIQSIINITERKRAENKTAEIKESYERLIDNADEAIFRVDAKGGHVIYLNDAAKRIFGYTLAEYSSDPAFGFKIIHPDYQEKQREIIEEINTTKKTIKSAVLGWIAKDGHEVLMEYTIIPVLNKDGEIAFFESIGRDITKRRKTEEALRESEEKLRIMFESIEDGIAIVDLTGKILEVNAAHLRIFGFSHKEEIIGQNAFDHISKKDRARAIEGMKNIFEEENSDLSEYTLCKKDGGEFDAELSASLLHNSSGKPVGVISVTRDITKRKEIKGALQESEKKYSTLVEMGPDGVLLVQGKKILFANHRFYEMFGFSESEIIDKTIVVLLSGYMGDLLSGTSSDERIGFMKNLQNVMQGSVDPSCIYQVPFKKKNGDIIWVEINSNPIEYNGKPAEIVLLRDITEHKRLEDELQESYDRLQVAYAELKEVDQMKTDFVSVVTHELRTPLAIIRNNFEMFLDGTFGDLNEVQNESMEMLFKNINRLVKVVQDSLEMSRIYGGRVKIKPEPLNIGELFEKIVSDMKLLAEEKGHELSLEVSEGVSVVKCDGDKITQVLTNLLYNAIKFTPNGGKISVNVKNADENGSILVEVKDNGIGIPKDEHENIFKQFYEVDSRLNHETGGTGLGLSIAKGVVEAHGGKIWVESTPEVGSTFSFTIRGQK